MTILLAATLAVSSHAHAGNSGFHFSAQINIVGGTFDGKVVDLTGSGSCVRHDTGGEASGTIEIVGAGKGTWNGTPDLCSTQKGFPGFGFVPFASVRGISGITINVIWYEGATATTGTVGIAISNGAGGSGYALGNAFVIHNP